jgi:hypothetical protein
MDGLRWVGDLWTNSFPELKPLIRGNPIQLHPAVGHDELHRACSHEFSDEVAIKMPDASALQWAALVPELTER